MSIHPAGSNRKCDKLVIQGTIQRFGINALSFSVLTLIAFSWLVFPYLLNGNRMLFETGEQVKTERYQNYSTLNRMLSRSISFPGGIDVAVLYASEEYFEYADRADAVKVYRPDRHLVFFVNEDAHTEHLPIGLPDAHLQIGDRMYQPASVEGPNKAEHHRTTIIRFSKMDENGKAILPADDPSQILLKLNHPWDRYALENGTPISIESTYIWNLPLNIPPELKSRDTFTSVMMFSLSAGLLSSVLTPCLIQLVLVFFATLGGISAKEVINAQGITPDVRRRIMWAASCFVAGYVALFIACGALIGFAGKEAQLFFANYTRPVGVIAGIIVVLFGIWVGIHSQTPLVCRIPGASMVQKIKSKGLLGTVLVSIAFSLGCMSCFGGAIIGTLLIYVGALGSATVGATVMGVFAAGVAIPFLLTAIFFSKMRVLFEFIGEHSKAVGMLSTAIIVSFGILLITDNFHTVSDLIYPYLGLH